MRKRTPKRRESKGGEKGEEGKWDIRKVWEWEGRT